MPEDARIGAEVGGYIIQSVLGRMGIVYLAEHIGLRRKVALKVLPDPNGVWVTR